MPFRRIVAKLFSRRDVPPEGEPQREPHERRTSNDWRREFELEKELRRGMRGD